ncbi:hypothetical protein BT96DRAFT_1080538 [Gymnopus androsaceus JB14]|uniref:G-protein coupled receptors family 1 profile domain-containing protein n=1 Tax=Gymnopus androsaceus JB14 TaxID=1447944 RepID=A0A6A4HZC9_9AGAR|nr:hypothetical protein BT96DRAFT_1080538 [Gymnopus androsaceus JB14]
MTPVGAQQIALAGSEIFQNICVLIFMSALTGKVRSQCIRQGLLPGFYDQKRENNGRAQNALIAVLLVVFFMIVLDTCQINIVNLVLVKFRLVVSLPSGLVAQQMAANSKSLFIVASILQYWSENLIFLIADTTIIWRAWAIWSENRIVKATLLTLFLFDIGVNVSGVIVNTLKSINQTGSRFNAETLVWLGIVVNLVINILATSLIAYRAWVHHKSVRIATSNARKTQVVTILLLCIESGTIFGIIQVLNLVFQGLDVPSVLHSPIHDTSRLIEVLYTFSAAINPIACLLLVHTAKTHEQTFQQDFETVLSAHG